MASGTSSKQKQNANSKVDPKEKPQPIQNADAVIKLFGGIRPMASKLEIAATTVQGWSKRGVIPANRTAQIMKIASDNAIILEPHMKTKASKPKTASSGSTRNPAKGKPVKAKASAPVKAQISTPTAEKVISEKTIKAASNQSKISRQSKFSDQSKVSSQSVANGSKMSSVAAPVKSIVSEKTSLSDTIPPNKVKEMPAMTQNKSANTTQSKASKMQAPKKNATKANAASVGQSTASRKATPPKATPSLMSSSSGMSASQAATTAELKAMTDKSFKRNLLFSGSLVAIALVAGFFLFGKDDVRSVKQDMVSIQQKVENIEGQTSFLEQAMPSNLGQNLASLKSEMGQLGEKVSGLTKNVTSITKTLSDSTNGSVMNRISMLEGKIGAMGGGEALQGLLQKVEAMSSTLDGQQDLGAALAGLAGNVEGLQDQMNGIDGALERAKTDNAALSEALEGVTGRDLGAAAMLMTLGHVRNVFNREAPFEDDLQIVRGVMGSEDTELNAAIDRLTPYAKDGVLSTETLKEELKTIGGEVIMAKLAGQDASFQDKALQRLSSMVEVSKNGVPVNDSPEQKAIAQAQKMLDEGNVEAAMASLATLKGPAADAANPWMEKAEGHVAAQDLEGVILDMVMGKIDGLRPTGLFGKGSGSVYTDPNTGMSILNQ